jgi:hypothetical protein
MKRFIIPVFVAVAVVMAGLATSAGAKPPGDTRDSDVGKMLYKFNIVAIPQEWSGDDTVCQDNGARMFFQRGGGAIGTVEWQLDPAAHGFQLTDCDGTTDGTGVVLADEKVSFYVMVRLLGPPTDSLNLVCEDKVVSDNQDDLCIIDSVNLTKQGFTKIMDNIYDGEYEEVLWTLSSGTDFRIADVRVYEKL